MAKPVVQIVLWGDFKVAHRSARLTQEVIVWVDKRIVSAESLAEVQL
jgi:hypothetical protein